MSKPAELDQEGTSEVKRNQRSHMALPALSALAQFRASGWIVWWPKRGPPGDGPSEHFGSLVTWVTVKGIGAGIAVLVVGTLALMTPPAAAQNPSAWLSPEAPNPVESDGTVVLTVEMWRAGRVEYRTFDGACEVSFSPGGTDPEAECRGPMARAPEDYASTSGELVFTEGGTKTVTIPIVDDDATEGNKSFTVAAWEEVNADPWIDRGDSSVVRILDDESGDLDTGEEPSSAAAGSTSDTTSAGGQPSASSVTTPARVPASGADVSVDPATPTSAMPSSRDLRAALPVGKLRPGPGFELTSDGLPEPAPARGNGGGGFPLWLVIGSGIATAGVGALAIVQRRMRWSPTRA